jgi:hypothetical protein
MRGILALAVLLSGMASTEAASLADRFRVAQTQAAECVAACNSANFSCAMNCGLSGSCVAQCTAEAAACQSRCGERR